VSALIVSNEAAPALLAQERPIAAAVTRADLSALRVVDQQVDQMVRSGNLRVRESVRDSLMPDRTHERLDQYVRGVRIVGGDITRQIASDGTVSIFGTIHDVGSLSTDARLSADDARAAIATAVSGQFTGAAPELVVLPLADGYHLAYFGRATAGNDRVKVFVDAASGELLQRFSEFISEVGVGIGQYGDQKKLSVKASGGTFIADDGLRPAAITTYDMKGNLSRTESILDVITPVLPSDIASDSDDNWTDRNVVDAHAYAGWYYDYLSKRFSRKGLDNNNLRMPVFVHPVRIEDIGKQPSDVIGLFYLNAFSCDDCGPKGLGAIVLGEGAPLGTYYRNIDVKPFSAALDVVAHELTHQVTSNSAQLNGYPFSEAGALNEGFSDIFGISTAFYFLPAGNGPMQASYFQGKDLTVPSGFFGRSLSNPQSTGDPDHYSQRIVGYDPHYNSTILSHAFYLAIEGGTNRTSGLSVAGVGAANREQIEKVFFRALTVFLPSNATYALTRVATIQAARDLYGVGSAAERAVTQAWAAVGVADRTVPTAVALPNPAVSMPNTCGGFTPSWELGITVSAGSSNLQITQWVYDVFDSTGANIEHAVLPPSSFASFFNQCGLPSARIVAQADACAVICTEIRGKTSGSEVNTFTAIDGNGQIITFATPRVALQK
jgi:Zn-dependent metalloprotease